MATHYPSIQGRVFSVTGGMSGIGLATVKLLATHGASAIHIGDWNVSALDQVNSDISTINPLTKLTITKLDVFSSSQVESWVTSIGPVLHGAANVAGVSQPAHAPSEPAILCQDDDSWSRTIGVNLNGIMYCTRAQVRTMVKLAPGENLAIVNVASMASLLRGPVAFAYGASKAACAHFSSCVAKDVYKFGVRVNSVSPGNTFTPMTKEFFGDLTKDETEAQLARLGVQGRMLKAEDIARAIVFLLSESSLHVNGVNLPVGEGAP